MIPWQIPAIGLAVCLVVLVAIALAPAAKAFRMWWFAIASIILTIYAGTKPQQHLWSFEFQNGVHDAGSYCTNDLVHAEWTYIQVYAQYTLKAKYRDLTITNEVGVCIDAWHDLEDAVVAMQSAEWIVPNATNMSIVCYAEYVPPQHVVTNGVYHMEGVSRSMATTNSPAPDYVTWGTRVEVVLPNGAIKVITPTNRPPEPILLMNNQGETNE